jgi:hypothetical protein
MHAAVSKAQVGRLVNNELQTMVYYGIGRQRKIANNISLRIAGFLDFVHRLEF